MRGRTWCPPLGKEGRVKVIGAGFGRTGTASLKAALEELGFGPCYHMMKVFEHPEHADFWEAVWRGEPVNWDKVLEGYEATVDWPACTFYGELMERHPEAKVLLSVRDPERWYESMRSTIYELTKLSTRSLFSRVGLALLSLFRFGTFTIRPLQMGEQIGLQGTVRHVPRSVALDDAAGPDGAVVPGSLWSGVQGVRQNPPIPQIAGDGVAYGGVPVA
jgi:Sulfotransferase domain